LLAYKPGIIISKMATIRKIAQYAAFLLLFLYPSLALALTEMKTGAPAKSYLPGDFIHIMVEAPVDTASILAVMPDNTQVKMLFDRQSGVWHGLWQVPFGFKTGNYYAKLNAVDLEGNSFVGQSAPFVIGEQTMVMLVGKTSPEAVRRTVLAQEEEVIETTAEVRAVEGQKPKVEAQRVEQEKRAQMLKVRFAVAARFYIERLDFDTVRRKLQTLIKISPENKELKVMLKRVDAIIKAKGGGR